VIREVLHDTKLLSIPWLWPERFAPANDAHDKRGKAACRRGAGRYHRGAVRKTTYRGKRSATRDTNQFQPRS
jgi:hypothetical protein